MFLIRRCQKPLRLLGPFVAMALAVLGLIGEAKAHIRPGGTGGRLRDACLALLSSDVVDLGYRRGECLLNAGELARQLVELGFDPSELSMLIVFHRQVRPFVYSDIAIEQCIIGDRAQANTLPVPEGPSPAERRLWKFHTILNTPLGVIDQDYLDPRNGIGPLSASLYFANQFPILSTETANVDSGVASNRIYRPRVHNVWRDLVVLQVPASWYLEHFPSGRPTLSSRTVVKWVIRIESLIPTASALDEFLRSQESIPADLRR